MLLRKKRIVSLKSCPGQGGSEALQIQRSGMDLKKRKVQIAQEFGISNSDAVEGPVWHLDRAQGQNWLPSQYL